VISFQIVWIESINWAFRKENLYIGAWYNLGLCYGFSEIARKTNFSLAELRSRVHRPRMPDQPAIISRVS